MAKGSSAQQPGEATLLTVSAEVNYHLQGNIRGRSKATGNISGTRDLVSRANRRAGDAEKYQAGSEELGKASGNSTERL